MASFGAGYGGQQQMSNQVTQFTESIDTELPLPPNISEPISCLKFAPINQTFSQFGPPMLLAAFWDGNMIIY